jgi:hypothetical protein
MMAFNHAGRFLSQQREEVPIACFATELPLVAHAFKLQRMVFATLALGSQVGGW